MKKATLILILTGLFFQVTAPPPGYLIIAVSDPINPYERLWEATCKIESNNDPYAVGDTHLDNYSFGIVQIRQIRLDDYNMRAGQSYLLQDVFDTTISKQIWMYYATKFHPSDYEQISKCWNGSGVMTEEYWEKIKKQLKIIAK